VSFGEDVSALVQKSRDGAHGKADWWERTRLGDIATILNGFPWKSERFSKVEGVPLIRIRDVTTGTTETRYDGPITEGYWIEPGDLLVGMDGDFNLRRWRSDRALLNQRVCRITTAKDYYATEFLERVLPEYLRLVNSATSSVTVKHLSSRTLADLPLPLPPLSEQHRIVAKLDALTAHLARARAELDRVPVLGERHRLALLRSAVTGDMTATWRRERQLEPVAELLDRVMAPRQGRGGREATDKIVPGAAGLAINQPSPSTQLPGGWMWVSLLRIAKQETGHTPSRSNPSYWDCGVPWIGIRDAGAHHGQVIHETLQTISVEGLENSSARLLPAGTVCLSRTASVGYVTIMGRSMATSQDFATWTCSEALLPEYLMYALMAEGDDIRKFGMGSTHTTIYFPEIRALHIALPPIEEQHEIVARVKSAFARAHRLEAEAARARALIDRLESAILAKAFRGELVPQDPNDEPASVLLDRIRAQRAAAPRPKRRGRAQAPAA
jgi:type I restriction enzyme S subunit